MGGEREPFIGLEFVERIGSEGTFKKKREGKMF